MSWETKQLQGKGKQWKTAYLPVWLYSYLENKGQKGILHYVAVNARTKETMGSIPVHKPKLFAVSGLIELIGLMIFIAMSADDSDFKWIFLLTGFIYFAIIYLKYRNSDARHHHETETKKKMFNLKQVDELIKRRTGLTNSEIEGANNTKINGSTY